MYVVCAAQFILVLYVHWYVLIVFNSMHVYHNTYILPVHTSCIDLCT